MYRPTQVQYVQGTRSDEPDWGNENIYKTSLQPIYVRTCNDSKNIHDKGVMVMNNNLDIYGACRHTTTFYQFFLITDGPI